MAGIAHIAVGVLAGRLHGGRSGPQRWVAMGAFTLLSMLPDLDVLPVAALGVGDHGLAGHRGFTHTFLFALLISLITAFLFRRRSKNVIGLTTLVFMTVASHGILDAFTADTRGLPLFWPVDSERLIAVFRPLPEAPTGLAFFSLKGLQNSLLECLFFAPMLAVAFWPRPWVRGVGGRRVLNQGLLLASGLAACLLFATLLRTGLPQVARAFRGHAVSGAPRVDR
ncbi:MAG: metal-dependent hydrolase [Deltaproteobacteria bacterium]|nr:metal-dependent hydrolase [Deltaproteobacteria bacterium]